MPVMPSLASSAERTAMDCCEDAWLSYMVERLEASQAHATMDCSYEAFLGETPAGGAAPGDAEASTGGVPLQFEEVLLDVPSVDGSLLVGPDDTFMAEAQASMDDPIDEAFMGATPAGGASAAPRDADASTGCVQLPSEEILLEAQVSVCFLRDAPAEQGAGTARLLWNLASRTTRFSFTYGERGR